MTSYTVEDNMEQPDNQRLHRFTLLVAACTLLLVVAGGIYTSHNAALSGAQSPFSAAHRIIASAVGLLTLLLAAFAWRTEFRYLAVTAAILVMLQGALGAASITLQYTKPLAILHDVLALAFFSLLAALAVLTSPSWRSPAPDGVDPGLRKEGRIMVVILIIQVFLGALVRHNLLNVAVHATMALGVIIFLLWVGMRSMMEHKRHPPIRTAALWLLSIGCSQLFLGMAAFASKVLTATAIQPMPFMIAATVTHVTVGALTLAAGVVLALQLSRGNLAPATLLARPA